MPTHNVFLELGESLERLFRAEIPELKDKKVDHKSPGDINFSNMNGMSIFLYRTSKHEHLNNSEPTYIGNKIKKQPPLYLELHYLFTAIATDSILELSIFEGIIRTLYENPVIREPILSEELAEQSRICATPAELTVDDLNKLWGTFPNKPLKPALAYKVTPVAIFASVEETISRVGKTSVSLNENPRKS